jgi:transcriptional regulator with XRE-family HTH domain
MDAVSSPPLDETPEAALRGRLRKMREAAGLSQGELGVQLGREQSWASRIERGSHIELHEIEAWARVCGSSVRVEWGPGEAGAQVAVSPDRVRAVEQLAELSPEDLELLARAAALLASAPTARDRLAFEVRMWEREAHAAAVTSTVAAVASRLGAVLHGDDAEAMRLLQERRGISPAPPVAARKTGAR